MLKLVKVLLICTGCWLFSSRASAQTSAAPGEQNQVILIEQDEPKNDKSFGGIMLKLGKGLLGEVKRRLNLEEAEIITVTKQKQADGSLKYHVDTGKFAFDIKKKPKKKDAGKK